MLAKCILMLLVSSALAALCFYWDNTPAGIVCCLCAAGMIILIIAGLSGKLPYWRQ